jgi:hypothetical protein
LSSLVELYVFILICAEEARIQEKIKREEEERAKQESLRREEGARKEREEEERRQKLAKLIHEEKLLRKREEEERLRQEEKIKRAEDERKKREEVKSKHEENVEALAVSTEATTTDEIKSTTSDTMSIGSLEDNEEKVDEMLASYIQQSGPKTPEIKKDIAGQYEVEGQKLNIKIVDKRLVVRIGGGWMKLEDFLTKYETSEKMNLIIKDPTQPPKTPKSKKVGISY